MADSGIGDKSDTKATNTTGNWSLIALVKYLIDTAGSPPSGGATAANQTTQITAEQAILAKLLTAPATEAKQDTQITALGTLLTTSDFDTKTGALTETAPATDTASSGINGRLQRIAQRLTTLLAVFPTTIDTNSGAKSASTLRTVHATDDTMIGALTETAPANDTASSGLNGRLQRIAQRLTSLLAGTPVLPVTTTPVVTTVAANNTDLVSSMDVTNYRSGSLQLAFGGTATVQIQFSLDGGTTWVACRATNRAGATASSLTAANIYDFAIPHSAAMRIRTTAWSSGNVSGALGLSTVPIAPQTTELGNTSSVVGGSTIADTTGLTSKLASFSLGGLYNGASYDMARANTANTVLASAARTGTVSTDVTNYNGRTIAVTLNITVAPNTASTLTLQIRLKDSISGNYVTLLASAAIVGTATTGVVPVTNEYRVGQGITVTANVSAADVLGKTLNVNMVHSNADSWTYSVSADIGL